MYITVEIDNILLHNFLISIGDKAIIRGGFSHPAKINRLGIIIITQILLKKIYM